ncbi:cyclic nucleotide-gated ion channel [Methylocystis sp. ATCC 49242]|uniref:cyclic nucleotide-gated ion channel n=1 Tax=Methylocystis sp. ATCC 49242 TaxID=622637 RepID=UPI0001F88891|nr:cyclic nucleotide-gated ion channel [Methylocystis sp. ATCC 49242]
MSTEERRRGLAWWRRRLHVILDGGAHDRLARFVHRALIGLVALSVGSVILESVPEYAEEYERIFTFIEYVAVGAFTLEYFLRLWCAPEHTPYSDRTPFGARVAFVKSGSAIIDLLTILPVYLSFFIEADLRVFLILRLLRFFKLARYSPGIRTIIAVLEAERKALLASGILLFGAVLFSATAMHVAEHTTQPEKFGSIPASMWWAIVTITTVGYGDVTPVTLAGRVIASFTMVLGYVMLGLPVGIVATAFAEEIHRREFVVTWSMVASVPLFRELDAQAIAEIMRYLRAQSVPAGTLIVRRGEVAHSMYFIAEGEVEIELPTEVVRLGVGQFFGEIAVLHKTLRTASVRATEPTKLLILDAYDLQTLTARNPEIGLTVRRVAASRTELSAQERHGDMIEAELEQPVEPEPKE